MYLKRCNACVSLYDDEHQCIPQKLQGDCPICHEILFQSTEPLRGLKCGHVMHLSCYTEYRRGHSYTCPLCMRSMEDMRGRCCCTMVYEISLAFLPCLCQNTLRCLMPLYECNQCRLFTLQRGATYIAKIVGRLARCPTILLVLSAMVAEATTLEK